MSRGGQVNQYNDESAPAYAAGETAYRDVSRKWKRFVLFALLFFLFVYIIVTGLISISYAGQVIRPVPVPSDPINKNLAYPYSTVSFRSRDGYTSLYGWHFNAQKTDKALILVHGFGGNRFLFGDRTLDFIESVLAIGFNALVFDLRNSGGASPGISTFGLHEKQDVLGAVDYMKNAGYENIAILGVSTGANAAVMAGAEAAVDEVKALILDSPIVDARSFIMRLVREINPELPDFPYNIMTPAMIGLYVNGDVNDVNAAKNLDVFMPRHVLLIHGTNDEIVSYSDTLDLYNDYMNKAVGKVSIWSVPGAGHGACFDAARDEYMERVTAYLQRVFIE